jgi:hypothetical protein
LLILVGEEGEQLEARDYKKLSDVIVTEYLQVATPEVNDVIVRLFSSLQSLYPKWQGQYP